MVYKVEQIDIPGESYYLLFGFVQKDQYSKIKTLDILHFESGEAKFGKSIFKHPRESAKAIVKNRIFLEYSAEAFVTINYNPSLDLIIFDHLIPRMGRIPGQGPTMVSDGSYEGYYLEGDKWIYKEKIYDLILDEAPRPKPLDKNRLSGTGRKKKN